MLYRFTDAEVDMLMNLALHNAVVCAAEYDGDRAGPQFEYNRADFLTACRIVAELHASSAPGAYMGGPLHLSMDDDMREAAAAEGVNVDKELSEFDPRANDPKCVHGRKRSEECQECKADTGAYAHKIAPHEQAALDAALIERNRELLARAGISTADDMPAPVPELERVRSVMHRDSCPVSHEHFQPVIGGPSQCTCDFGQRLASELGIPYVSGMNYCGVSGVAGVCRLDPGHGGAHRFC